MNKPAANMTLRQCVNLPLLLQLIFKVFFKLLHLRNNHVFAVLVFVFVQVVIVLMVVFGFIENAERSNFSYNRAIERTAFVKALFYFFGSFFLLIASVKNY